MRNAHLKKRIMAGLVSGALAVSTTAVLAPEASADAAVVSAYEKLPAQVEQRVEQRQMELASEHGSVDNATGLLPSQYGPGWCIDWGIDNPWNNPGGYEYRKLTGMSGRYGSGLGINKDIEKAAISVTKSMLKDYKEGNAAALKAKSRMLQALLSNNRAYLNDVRADLQGNAVFTQLTGFKIGYQNLRQASSEQYINYYLIPTPRLNEIRKEIKDWEYLTVAVPKNYNLEINRYKEWTFQRLIIITQPGLEIERVPGATEVTTTVRPESTVTTTLTNNRETTISETLPATTQTTTETLPPKYETVTSTRPAATKTVTSTPTITRHVEVVENGTTTTKTSHVPGEPKVVTTTVEGATETSVKTVTETVKTVTKPATTVTQVTTIPEYVTTTQVVPGDKAVETVVTTGKPVEETTRVTHEKEIIREREVERIREIYEYYSLLVFRKEENTKIIDLGDKIKGGFTWKITKGQDLVIVEHEQGTSNLKITPKPDFKGSGTVEIVVTDENGNEHVFRVEINKLVTDVEQINTTVNNYFYNINQGGSKRTQIITLNKGEKAEIIKGGEIATLDDDGPGRIMVRPKDGQVTGKVIINITNENGVVRKNTITIENFDTQYDVRRTIFDTSVGFVERKDGDTFKITSDTNKVIKEIVEDGANWRIIPNEGTTGEAKVTFTSKDGKEYKFTFEVIKDENAGPDIRERVIDFDGSANIEYREGHTATIVAGEQYAKVEKEGNQWVVRPLDGAKTNGGRTVVHIKNEKGVLLGIWNIEIKPDRTDVGSWKKEVRNRDTIDRTNVKVSAGFTTNHLRIASGEDVVVDKKESKNSDGQVNDLQFRFKPGTTGKVVVQEVVRYYDPKNIPSDVDPADVLSDDAGTPVVKKDADGKEYVEIVVTEWVYSVKPAEVKEITYDITSDNTVTIYGTDLDFISGEDVLTSTPTDGQNTMVLDPKRQANGKVVVENRTEDGYIFERYTVNIKPGLDSELYYERTMTTDAVAKIGRLEGDKLEPTENGEYVNIDAKGDYYEVTAKGKEAVGKKVVLVAKDSRGVYAHYTLIFGAPAENGTREYTVSTNSEFRVLQIKPGHTMSFESGASNFDVKQEKGDAQTSGGEVIFDWVAKPKPDSAGKQSIVLEKDENGKTINRYKLNIVQGKKVSLREVYDVLLIGEKDKTFTAKSGNTIAVTSGSQFVDVVTTNNSVKLTAKEGTQGNRVIVEEKDKDGAVVVRHILTIVPQGWTSEGAAPNDPAMKDYYVIDRKDDGTIVIRFKNGHNGTVIIPETSEGAKVEKDGNGNWILTPSKTGKVNYIVNIEGVGQSAPQEIDVYVSNKNGSSTDGFSDPKCIAGLVGLASPLLLLVPLGILSQVRIPGLEQVSAQVNAAIRRANDDIQRGLGIYDRDRAKTAAGLEGAFAVENPQLIGLAAGALGAITAGLLITDLVLRTCGVDEATSSYQLGKATGNDTLIKGSSLDTGEAAKPSGSKEEKPSTENK